MPKLECQSAKLHNEGMQFVESGNYASAIYSFIKAYSINDANNENGHLFRLAWALANDNNIKLAKIIFNECLKYITDQRLLLMYIQQMEKYLDKQNILNFCHILISRQVDEYKFFDYTAVLEGLIEIKSSKFLDVQKEINALNFKYINNRNKDRLIVVFNSRKIGNYFEHQNLLKDINADILFLRDVQDAWYNNGLKYLTKDIASTVDFIKNFSKQYPHVMTMGASSGGYAALLFGSLLKCERILTICPQTLLPREKGLPDAELLKGINPKYFDIIPYIDNEVMVDLCFSLDYESDVKQCNRLSNMSNVNIHARHYGCTHNIMPYIIKDKYYFDCINKFIPINTEHTE